MTCIRRVAVPVMGNLPFIETPVYVKCTVLYTIQMHATNNLSFIIYKFPFLPFMCVYGLPSLSPSYLVAYGDRAFSLAIPHFGIHYQYLSDSVKLLASSKCVSKPISLYRLIFKSDISSLYYTHPVIGLFLFFHL